MGCAGPAGFCRRGRRGGPSHFVLGLVCVEVLVCPLGEGAAPTHRRPQEWRSARAREGMGARSRPPLLQSGRSTPGEDSGGGRGGSVSGGISKTDRPI
jgi:hypothetical protein